MNKKDQLVNYLASQGIFEAADVDKEIQKMAEQCPTATAAEKGLTDVVDKAYETMMIRQGGKPSVTDSTSAGGTAPVPAVTNAQVASITKTLLAQTNDRAATSQSTTIDSYIFDKPAPDEVIPAGTQGILTEKGWTNFIAKIESGEYTVCPDDDESVDEAKRIASTTNFNALKAAYESKTPVDVYIGQRGTKPIGYNVRRGNTSGTAAQPEQMTREELKNFVILHTAGYILRDGNGPAVTLKSIAAKNDNATPGATQPSRTVLSDVNKKAAIENGMFEVARQVTPEMKDTSQKAALKVRVFVNGKTNNDGTPKKLTKTFSVTASTHATELKAAYVDKFSSADKGDNLATVPDKNKLAKLQLLQANAIAELRNKASDPEGMIQLQAYAEDLAKFDTAASGAQASNVAL